MNAWPVNVPEASPRSHRHEAPCVTQLADYGCNASVEAFRQALIDAKNEAFPTWGIEDLTYTKNQAADYCALVRQKLDAPKLPRVFILKQLVNCRKNGQLRERGTPALPPATA